MPITGEPKTVTAGHRAVYLCVPLQPGGLGVRAWFGNALLIRSYVLSRIEGTQRIGVATYRPPKQERNRGYGPNKVPWGTTGFLSL